MEKNKCKITTFKQGNTIKTVIESKSQKLTEFCDKLRSAKSNRIEKLRNMNECAINIEL